MEPPIRLQSTDPAQSCFGFSAGVSGDTLVVGSFGKASGDAANQSGSIQVFVQIDGAWSQQACLKSSQATAEFDWGYVLAISEGTIAVCSPDGPLEVFSRTGSVWGHVATFELPARDGSLPAKTTLAVCGDFIAVGIPNPKVDAPTSALDSAGSVLIFGRSQGLWEPRATLRAAQPRGNDFFGAGVGLSDNTLAVGAWGDPCDRAGQVDLHHMVGSGAGYIFTCKEGAWTQEAYLKADSPRWLCNFGWSAAISGNTAVYGCPSESRGAPGCSSKADWGAAYVFTRTGGTWTQTAFLTASDAEACDHFGLLVAIDGDTIAVATPDKRNAVTSAISGAAYLFKRNGTTWLQEPPLHGRTDQLPSGNPPRFGISVALSGSIMAVGAPTDEPVGSVYVYGINRLNPASGTHGLKRFDPLKGQPPRAEAD